MICRPSKLVLEDRNASCSTRKASMFLTVEPGFGRGEGGGGGKKRTRTD